MDCKTAPPRRPFAWRESCKIVSAASPFLSDLASLEIAAIGQAQIAPVGAYAQAMGGTLATATPHFVHQKLRGSEPAADTRQRYAKFLLCLSVFQFFLPNYIGTELAIYMPFVILFTLGRIAKAKPTSSPYSILVILFAVKLFYILSSDMFAGIRDIWVTLPFIGFFLLSWRELNFDDAADILKPAVIVGCFQSSLVIIFRLFPTLESAFWHSFAASLTMGPGVMAQFNGGMEANNVLDPAKAGGMMLNANVAGAWSMTMLFATAAINAHFKSKPAFLLICAAHLLAVLLCGSKASIMIVLALPAAASLIAFFSKAARPASIVIPKWLILIMPSLFVAVIGLVLFPPDISTFSENSTHTLQSRQIMWSFAWRYFTEHPFYGLGYGGWIKLRMMEVPAQAALAEPELLLPPHNSILAVWTYNGMAGVLVTLLFFATLLVRALRNRTLTLYERSMLLCAVGAPFLQSQGENFLMFGDYHMAGFMGLCAGLLINRSRETAPTATAASPDKARGASTWSNGVPRGPTIA